MQIPGASARFIACCKSALVSQAAAIEAIYRERYTEEQLARRIEYRSRRDRPLWNHLRRVEQIDAAE